MALKFHNNCAFENRSKNLSEFSEDNATVNIGRVRAKGADDSRMTKL